MFSTRKIFSLLFGKLCNKYFPTTNYTIFHFTTSSFLHNDKITIYNNFLNSAITHKKDKIVFIKLYNETHVLMNVFHKFYNKISHKKTEMYDSELDMSFEPLNNLNTKYKYTFFHVDKLYTFSVSDMIRIINTNLIAHDSYLFSMPTFPKNPYNNIEFTDGILYNLYLHLISYSKIPEIFKRFVDCSLSLNKFARKNEVFIREYYINNYDKILTFEQIYQEIIFFLKFQNIPHLFIHVDFPKEKVVQKFKNCFKYFMHSNYNLSALSRKYYYTLLNKKISYFIKNDITFGRIILKRGYKKKNYPHINYKMVNLMDQRIPDFHIMKTMYAFMEFGGVLPDNEPNNNLSFDMVGDYLY